jgi:hypothetical protein
MLYYFSKGKDSENFNNFAALKLYLLETARYGFRKRETCRLQRQT